MKHLLIWFFNLIILTSHFDNRALAAACCGGGFATPAIIIGDDKAQLTSSYTLTEVVVDSVDQTGIWRTWDTHQQVQTFKLEGAHIFRDRFQAGFSVPVIQRQRDSNNYSGLGDISTSLGYEYLPEWNYNPLRPKGIGYIQFILPTGRSRADSEVGGLDSRGHGFWAIGLGTILTKSWIKFDSFISIEAHKSFNKNVSNSQFTGRLTPGYGGQIGFGTGYNTQKYRFGTSLTWTYEDAVRIDSSSSSLFNNTGALERYSTAVINTSYLANEEWSGTLSYLDQTLFGSPVNTSLGQGVSIQIQKRWGR